MIPPFCDESTSAGEKKFFEALTKLNDDYTVIHSLGIADHREKVFGEIDFVIICSRGILCLEVKGGYVRRQEGAWIFTNRHGMENIKAEGPFRQVLSAMLSLRAYFKKTLKLQDPLSNCQFACGVVFPDMPFTASGPDIISEIIFDSRQSTEDLENYIKSTFQYWRKQLEEKHGFYGKELGPESIKRARNLLRGDFGFVPSLGYIVKRTGEQLLALTQTQIDRLAMAADNRRILLSGVAGTGKTVISFEYALRNAQIGRRVIYLCFNKNLARYLDFALKKEDPGLIENLHIYHFHSYITAELNKSGALPDKHGISDNTYYGSILPEAFQDTVTRRNTVEPFDVLVVDEGQDLLRYEYLMCFDHLLSGGLEHGFWHICYDSNQNIYNDNESFAECLEMVKGFSPVMLSLDTNCRNTRPIGVYNTLITGVHPAKRFRVDGEAPERFSYLNNEDQKLKLIDLIKKLLRQGVNPGDIVLLSKYKYENSCVTGDNIFKSVCAFQNISDLKPVHLVDNSIKFSTVHSFKGLEAPVVIFLDIDGFEDKASRAINYTAISRASSLIYIFYKQDKETEMLKMVEQSSIYLNEIAG